MLFALLICGSLSIASAILSVPVVLRRWAFIGEGIGHSAFGEAGVAWILALIFPALDVDWAPYAFVIFFCLATALGIGWLSRSDRVHSDTAIGVFMVAALAFGFVAQQIYAHVRHGTPAWFDDLLFGQMRALSAGATIACVSVCVAVIIIVALLAKEILAYCFDPLTARTSGVREGFVHYLLMLLLALVIVIGVRVAGSVLVTALLVLPGATALLVARKLASVMSVSIVAALISAVGGLLLHARWTFLPVGPAIVLILVIEFAVAYIAGHRQAV